MTEELFGVCTDGVDKNYLRRLPDGRINVSLGGRFMTKEVAEQLCRILRTQGYPKAVVVQLFRIEEDEAPAETLLQLENEKLPINTVYLAVRDAVRFGDSKEEILATVQKALSES